jgi:hypothetical protein
MLLSLADFSFATKSTVVKPRESKASFILVKALCEEMLPTLIEDRKELEKLIETTYKERKLTFEKSFEDFKQAITTNDVEKIISGLQSINFMYGKNLQFQTFKEFDDFMLNKNSVFKL